MNRIALSRTMRVNFARASSRLRFYTHGSLLYLDVRHRLRGETIATIFDVGGNIGQSVEELVTDYPTARIFTFEPNPTTFAELKANVTGYTNVTPFNSGFGREQATLRFDNTHTDCDMHQIALDQTNDSFPLVQIRTVDQFCATQEVAAIDFLKIDTEGYDLEVLRGARRMLGLSAIGIIVAECSANRDNTRHIPFCELHLFMENQGYRLFGIYEQVSEWPTSKPNLRRINVAYVSPRVLARN